MAKRTLHVVGTNGFAQLEVGTWSTNALQEGDSLQVLRVDGDRISMRYPLQRGLIHALLGANSQPVVARRLHGATFVVKDKLSVVSIHLQSKRNPT